MNDQGFIRLVAALGSPCDCQVELAKVTGNGDRRIECQKHPLDPSWMRMRAGLIAEGLLSDANFTGSASNRVRRRHAKLRPNSAGEMKNLLAADD